MIEDEIVILLGMIERNGENVNIEIPKDKVENPDTVCNSLMNEGIVGSCQWTETPKGTIRFTL